MVNGTGEMDQPLGFSDVDTTCWVWGDEGTVAALQQCDCPVDHIPSNGLLFNRRVHDTLTNVVSLDVREGSAQARNRLCLVLGRRGSRPATVF